MADTSGTGTSGTGTAGTGTERPGAGALGIREVAHRLTRCAWVEARAFEVVGAWPAVVPELGAKLLFAAQAPHFAWRAELWQGLAPHLWDTTGEPLPAAEVALLEGFVAALAVGDEADQTLERAAGLHRVLLPRLIACCTEHLSRATEVADAPTARWLALARHDAVEDWLAGEALVQALVATPEDAHRAAVHVGRLEGLLVAAGGISGAPPSGPLST